MLGIRADESDGVRRSREFGKAPLLDRLDIGTPNAQDRGDVVQLLAAPEPRGPEKSTDALSVFALDLLIHLYIRVGDRGRKGTNP